jgi:hypothetical protein
MAIIPNAQDLTQASGIIPADFLESIYEGFMDDAMQQIGRTVTFHLPPLIEQDVTTQSQGQSSQYNPFFGGVSAPKTTTRITGTKVTTQEVEYLAQIRVNPIGKDDTMGIGDLKDNQIMLTVVIEALDQVKRALSFTVEGRTYTIDETRPIGFSRRRYLMIKGTEKNDDKNPSPDSTVG